MERELDQLRDNIGHNLDLLLHRANPKTIVNRQVSTTKAHFVDTSGAPRTDNIVKVAAGVIGVVVVFAVLRRITR